MTVTRDKPYVSVTWIPKFLVGDRSCIWSCWFKAQHQDYERMPSDFDSAKWNAEHTDLVNRLIEELDELGCELFIERQNSFRVESASSGMIVSGKPDVIAVFPDGRTVIYDAKTGQQVAGARLTGAALHVSAAEVGPDALARRKIRGCGRVRERPPGRCPPGQHRRCLRQRAWRHSCRR